jgi:hypothetical protein
MTPIDLALHSVHIPETDRARKVVGAATFAAQQFAVAALSAAGRSG